LTKKRVKKHGNGKHNNGRNRARGKLGGVGWGGEGSMGEAFRGATGHRKVTMGNVKGEKPKGGECRNPDKVQTGTKKKRGGKCAAFLGGAPPLEKKKSLTNGGGSKEVANKEEACDPGGKNVGLREQKNYKGGIK